MNGLVCVDLMYASVVQTADRNYYYKIIMI